MAERERTDNYGDAVELHEIETHQDEDCNSSTPSVSTGEYRVVPHRTVSRVSRQERDDHQRKGLWRRTKKFWTHNVSLVVPQKSNRDHFALERTFLAYIRTSVMLSMQGVLIAQLFHLQRRSGHSTTRLGFYEVGVPLSTTYHGVAIVIALLGAHRFWKQQSAVTSGKVYAGGWELNCISILMSLVVLTTFALTVAIIVEINIHGR